MLKSDTVSYEALSIKTGLWLIMYVLHRFCGFGDSVYKMVTVSCACSVTGLEATSETRVRFHCYSCGLLVIHIIVPKY